MIAQQEGVRLALQRFAQETDTAVSLMMAVQQIPSPTFAEQQRAAFVQAYLRDLGLVDVFQDELHNVYGRFPGTNPHLPPVVLSAHNDTVFPMQTDLTLRRQGSVLHGPGIGDNSAGVAGLLYLAQTLRDFRLYASADVWFVANVGEEGMGDLRGMRAVVSRFGGQATYIVVEGGLYGHICHQSIGVRRFRLEVRAPGGHSWGSFGVTSAIHVLGHIIAAIDGLAVPKLPRTTFNVGLIEGGTSINSIAQMAQLWLDLRSEDPACLVRLEEQARQVVAEVAGRFKDTAVTLHLVGDRPAGQIPRQREIVQWAEAALRHVQGDNIIYMTGSTDANIPLSQGFSAVCIGLAQSANVHRLDESLDVTYLPQGLSQFLLLTLAVAGY